MQSFGFHVEVEAKRKESPILSAFLKGDTLKLLLTIEEEFFDRKGIHPDEKIAIKLEIDINPPPRFEVESKLVLNPVPFYVLTYQPPDLFAGKMHAILCRSWKNRVKGRDWYDLIWYIRNGIPIHLLHLSERLKQSGNLPLDETLNHEKLEERLREKIGKLDWEQAKG